MNWLRSTHSIYHLASAAVLTATVSGCGGGAAEPAPPASPSLATIQTFEVRSDSELQTQTPFALYLKVAESDHSGLNLQVSIESATAPHADVNDTFSIPAGQTSLERDLLIPSFSSDSGYADPVSFDIEVSSNQLVRSYTKSISVHNIPPEHELSVSIRRFWYNDTEFKRLSEQGELFVERTAFDPWPLPEDFTWREDPYQNNSWLLYYHSLAWLHGFEYGADNDDEAKWLAIIEDTILSYIEASPRAAPVNYMSWNDHTVAWRAETIAYFYAKYFATSLKPEQRLLIEKYLFDHALELRTLLDDDRFFAHNHSMYHALALFNLTFAVPTIGQQDDFRSAALHRMQELADEMVASEEGISREQSTSYQFVAMELFETAVVLTERLTGESDNELLELMTRMANVSAHLIYRNGGAPAIGDTNLGATSFGARLSAIADRAELSSDYVDFLTSDGAEGKALRENYTLTSEGYIFHRPSYSLQSPEVYSFIDFGNKLFSHGHHDAGNVIFAIDGEEVLVDSGGPYLYDSERRRYFQSMVAHNSLVIKNQDTLLSDATILLSQCLEAVCVALGAIQEAAYTHHRLVITSAEPVARLYVFDHATPTPSSAEGAAKLIYHFPSETKLSQAAETSPQRSTWELELPSSRALSIDVQANQNIQALQFEGFDSDNYQQGWVQPRFGVRLPAPVLEFHTAGLPISLLTSIVTEPTNDQPRTAWFERSGDLLQLDIGTHLISIDGFSSDTPQLDVMRR